jgi:hypothetical protein
MQRKLCTVVYCTVPTVCLMYLYEQQLLYLLLLLLVGLKHGPRYQEARWLEEEPLFICNERVNQLQITNHSRIPQYL